MKSKEEQKSEAWEGCQAILSRAQAACPSISPARTKFTPSAYLVRVDSLSLAEYRKIETTAIIAYEAKCKEIGIRP